MASFRRLLAKARRQRREDVTLGLIEHFSEVFLYMQVAGHTEMTRVTAADTLLHWLQSELDELPDDERAVRVILLKKLRSLLTLPGADSPFTYEVSPQQTFSDMLVDPTLLLAAELAQRLLTKEESEARLLVTALDLTPQEAGEVMGIAANKVRQLRDSAEQKLENFHQ